MTSKGFVVGDRSAFPVGTTERCALAVVHDIRRRHTDISEALA